MALRARKVSGAFEKRAPGGSVDYLQTGPRITPTDPSTDHPQNKIKKKKNRNKDFT